MKLCGAEKTTRSGDLAVCHRQPHDDSPTGSAGYHRAYVEIGGRLHIAQWFGQVVHLIHIGGHPSVGRVAASQTGLEAA